MNRVIFYIYTFFNKLSLHIVFFYKKYKSFGEYYMKLFHIEYSY